MSMGGGSTQDAVLTGPTTQAANAAAQAEITSAQVAAEQAQASTSEALNSLMDEYSTGLTYSNPAINTGNQAMAQLNYMLGLPAVNPGAAPTAPTAPTLAEAESEVTPEQVEQYIQENSTQVGGPQSGYDYTGVGATPNWSPSWGSGSAGMDMISGDTTPTIGTANAVGANMGNSLSNAITQEQAQEQLNNPESAINTTYNTAETAYNQQLDQYNQQQNVYNNYQSMGQATPANISDIVSNLPGYQFNMQQGDSAIQNAASASGMLDSGALLQQLDTFGQGIASTYYNNYLSQLQGLASIGTSASQSAASGAQNVGQQAASLYSNLGTDLGDADLAEGQALATSYTSPLADQTIQTVQTGESTPGFSLGSIGGLLGGLM